VSFDGTTSYDPDEDPLLFIWDFDALDGLGPDAQDYAPLHTYDNPGVYTVTLTVADVLSFTGSFCENSATTTATIGANCQASVINGYDTILLTSGRPTWFAFVQPLSDCYASTDVIPSSFVLMYAGKQVTASPGKAIISDQNDDGIKEIRANFSKDDLRALFSTADLGNGHNRLTVTIKADLPAGGVLQGTTEIDVLKTGLSVATVSPNPFNPSAMLTFTTTRFGTAKITMFDVAGRRVRTLLDERSLAPGVHDVRIDARNDRGEKLASGVYLYRVETTEGVLTGRITILK
jgi:PKD repeat protein